MLAARAQTQTQPCLVQHNVRKNQRHKADEQEYVHRQRAEIIDKRTVAVIQLRGGRVIHTLGDDHRQRGSQQVERRTADGLIRIQIDGCKRQQSGVYHARNGRRKDGNRHDGKRARTGRHQLSGDDAHQAADDHNAFQRNVDNAAALGEHAAQRNHHQHNRIQQRIFQQQKHQSSPPFPTETRLALPTSSARILFLKSSENAQR